MYTGGTFSGTLCVYFVYCAVCYSCTVVFYYEILSDILVDIDI